MYYAHTKKNAPKEEWQRLVDHLTQTADLAGGFADKFGAQQLGYIIGLLHDLGKYADEFQKRLEGERILVDHSTAGMQEAFQLYKGLYNEALAKIISYTICGHHSGLPDAGSENAEGTLECRRKKSICDYSAYKSEIQPPDLSNIRFPLTTTENPAFSFYFFIKMLFSCLVDADSLNTEHYTEEEKSKLRGQSASLKELSAMFDQHMQSLKANAEASPINSYRAEILQNCISKAQNSAGMFTLTVPTGGGKTLSSMAFALNHALKNKMERIIYVIPYTSIIEQNAAIFRKIFDDANVLEHHSNFQFKEVKEELETQEIAQKIKLATDNWKMPIVATTNVQFFESLFSDKRTKSRKLHNLAKSIIILDEAQMLPVKYLKPSLLALYELVKHYNSTVVLCTATQPNLDGLLPKGIKLQEIVASPASLYENLRRTQVKDLGELDDESLIEKLNLHDQVLCIVNRREHAKILHKKLAVGDDTEGIYHLSTKMYPEHRKQVLEEIRERLKASRKSEEPIICKVISTQLIEAGVDVDFPVVYRAMAGVDSIAQAAGRCNREGRQASADVFVFTPIEKHGQPPREIEINVSEAKSVFRNFDDPLSLAGISKYFELLYDFKNIDQKDILGEISQRAKDIEFPFAEVARRYKLIETNTRSVIVPANDECKKLIDQIGYAPTYHLVRKLQPYIISLYQNEFDKLMKIGGLSAIDSDGVFYALSDMGTFYDEHTGVVIRDDLLNEVLMI